MQLDITARHFEVTEALKTYAKTKLEKLHHYYDTISKIHLIFQIEKNNQIATATITAPHIEFHAEASSTDMYQSIDELSEKLMHQIKKHKEKIR